ncbi:hypothetical protein ACHAXR_001401, partial [Thalassiosira sp. AJA248-18]
QFPVAKILDADGNPWHKQKEFEKRVNHGIRGAHVAVAFQCESCWLLNLEGRIPIGGAPMDDTYIKMIRRVNLDIINGRAQTTIRTHVSELVRTIKDCTSFGKTPAFAPRGPMPMKDTAGMGLAVKMVHRSCTAKGKLGAIQWESLRKKRGTYSQVHETSPLGVQEVPSFSRGINKVKLSTCPSQSDDFSLFATGAERRMGYVSNADKALHIGAVVRVLELIQEEAPSQPPQIANELWKCGAAIAVGLIGSLRGPEIWMLDLAGIWRHIHKRKHGIMPARPLAKGTDLFNAPHVYLALLGKFKGKTGAREHLVAVCNTYTSGVQARWWIEKLIEVRLSEGCISGPAFGNQAGKVVSSFDMNAILHHYLQIVQSEPTPFIADDDDVIKHYSFDRSLRKIAEGRARAAGLESDIQKAMNRWQTIERAAGRRPKFNMQDHYSNARDLMPVTWRYAYVQ